MNGVPTPAVYMAFVVCVVCGCLVTWVNLLHAMMSFFGTLCTVV